MGPLGSSSKDDVRKAEQIKDAATPGKLSRFKGDVGIFDSEMMMIHLFWNMTPCRLVNSYRPSG
jgi:hypothetical protein